MVQIESSFSVRAQPDRVYEFLLDVNRVVGCVPGAQLAEVVDPDTFRGMVRIKVGPVTVSYQGTARITARDPGARSATLEAEGRETTGSGSARATTTMAVAGDGTVAFLTDFTVVGRVAQFGRGIMEDVARHLVTQMGVCIQAKLEEEVSAEVTGRAVGAATPAGSRPLSTEAEAPAAPKGGRRRGGGAPRHTPGPEGDPGGPAAETPSAPASGGSTLPVQQAPAEAPAPVVPLDALAVARAVAGERLRRLSRRPELLAAMGAALGAVALLIGWRRRRHG